MRRSGALLVVAAVLVVPASARAGAVEQFVNPDEGYSAISFQAAPGEENHVIVQVAAKIVTIIDSRVPLAIRGDSGCTRVDERTARCPRGPHVLIDLGDGADGARLNYSATVRGDFAEVYGGPGNDVLRGGDGGETLDGGPGTDFVHGGAGNDDLTGGEGRDQVFGGPGNDFLNVHDYDGKKGDEVTCQAGRDAINNDVDPADLVDRSCEKIASVGGGLPVAPAFTSAASGTWVMPCRGIGNGRSTRCSAHVVLTDRAGHVLAEGRGAMRTKPYRAIRMRTSRLRVSVRLTSLGRRVLLARRGVVYERISTYERVPGLGTTRDRPRFRLAW